MSRSNERRSRNVSSKEIITLVHDNSLPIDWEVDLASKDTDAVLLSFGRETVEKVIHKAAQNFVDDILQLRPNEYFQAVFYYTVRKGEPALEIEIQGGGSTQTTPTDFRLFIKKVLTERGIYSPSPDWKDSLFFESMYKYAKDQLLGTEDPDVFYYLQILLEEIVESYKGAHAEEIIDMIRNSDLAFDWKIEFRDDHNRQISLGILNRKILESFRKEEIEARVGSGLVDSLLEEDPFGRSKWDPRITILIRKGKPIVVIPPSRSRKGP
jgi:hypothetical protein